MDLNYNSLITLITQNWIIATLAVLFLSVSFFIPAWQLVIKGRGSPQKLFIMVLTGIPLAWLVGKLVNQ